MKSPGFKQDILKRALNSWKKWKKWRSQLLSGQVYLVSKNSCRGPQKSCREQKKQKKQKKQLET